MVSAYIGSTVLLGIAVLYTLLALGFPYGELAMGGKYRVMPRHIRLACGFSVVIQVVGILALLSASNAIHLVLPSEIKRIVCYCFSAFLLLNTIMNLLSKSKHERRIMTLLSLVTAICFACVAIQN
jgi:hypothetical protein